MKYLSISLLLLGLIFSSCQKDDIQPEIEDFPDKNFLNAIIEQGFDTNGDSIISDVEAEAVTSLNVYGCKITDVTGIEKFKNLDSFVCFSNRIENIDVSKNTRLKYLNCSFNRLTSLVVSSCLELDSLGCNGNSITSLDLSNNTALTYLDCSNCMLTGLDLSNNTTLINLYCYLNQLTSLDLSNNTALTYLDCGNCKLSRLDLSKNTALKYLECKFNQLAYLDVSNCRALKHLLCGNNQLTSLDISNCSSLGALSIDSMETLYEVCVWIMPFPPAGLFLLNSSNSPNVFFTSECS